MRADVEARLREQQERSRRYAADRRALARVLIVGCGCRGRELAAALMAEGHAVRGTLARPGRRRDRGAGGRGGGGATRTVSAR